MSGCGCCDLPCIYGACPYYDNGDDDNEGYYYDEEDYLYDEEE